MNRRNNNILYSSFNFIIPINSNSLFNSLNNMVNNTDMKRQNFLEYEAEKIFEEKFAIKCEIRMPKEYFDYIEKNIEDPNPTESNSDKWDIIYVIIGNINIINITY